MIPSIETIEQITQEYFDENFAPQEVADDVAPAPAPTDLYKNSATVRYDESQKTRPHGGSSLVKAVTQSVVDGDGAEGLAHAYRRAKSDSELYKSRGESQRAEIAKQQYMEEHFLPAVEVVVNYASPDELLNCKDALSTLDKYVLGVGSGRGYTASYVRTAYKDMLGQDLKGSFNQSDAVVSEQVCKIRMLADMNDIRTAVGLAKKIKKAIDNGEHIASEDDYALIGRVAAYGD